MPPRDLEREARLAAALRENLRKRKAQARARADEGAPPLTTNEDGSAEGDAWDEGAAPGEPPTRR